MTGIREIRDSLLHLLFPHVCSGCGDDSLNIDSTICLRCIDRLPETGFSRHRNNPIEKKFWGRLPLLDAMAQYYFTPHSLTQHLMHELKYKGNRDLGLQLGRIMGESLMASGRFQVDALIPLPLFPARERRRGYNQATVLCEGIAESLRVPVLKGAIIRSQHTDTQTRKGRIERWQNMEGKFIVSDPASIRDSNLLLVDDVITTGATLEACGMELLKERGIQLSIAALCYASH
jgi:ComF family protein